MYVPSPEKCQTHPIVQDNGIGGAYVRICVLSSISARKVWAGDDFLLEFVAGDRANETFGPKLSEHDLAASCESQPALGLKPYGEP